MLFFPLWLIFRKIFRESGYVERFSECLLSGNKTVMQKDVFPAVFNQDPLSIVIKIRQ